MGGCVFLLQKDSKIVQKTPGLIVPQYFDDLSYIYLLRFTFSYFKIKSL